uniref:long-chain-fatty-acid--CoA ligase n=1 Tax=Electrophorus electricus TaxID=8005 RepID=A0A4W4GKH7_ELEEL
MIYLTFTLLFAGLSALWMFQKIFYPYFWDDLMYCLKFRKVGKAIMARMKCGIITYLDCFVHQARKTPEKPFIVFENQVFTYKDVEIRSNKFANVFKTEAGLKHGDIVALLMSNEPDFVCVWLGLCQLGCEVAFLNFNTKSRSLLHCFQTCGANCLVVGSGIRHETFCFAVLLICFLCNVGLPKAARISHIKAVMSMAFLRLCGANENDKIYMALPLYHMAASLLGIGGCIDLGATCVLKKKFSASQFWKDCIKHDVTVLQYIGELCRYLVHQPKVDKAHRVRIAAGSGLRADVWKEFSRRFGKIQIREAYGLTEASIGFVNYTTEIGPIGRVSLPFELLKCHPETCEPVRTNTGRCVVVNKGETGLLVAPLSFTNPFLGYVGNKAMTEKKLLRDVFKDGDVYFNTGDLMLQDHRDFVYFKDRTGDTFRWKGENVATTEVSEILGCLDFLQEVNVYGVTVPGYEGRAGMAALVLKEGCELDGESLYNHLLQNLPAYSWPWFLRLQTSLDVTETFKQQKKELVEDGFCPRTIQEPLYFLDSYKKTYVPLTQHVYDDIVSGQIRL